MMIEINESINEGLIETILGEVGCEPRMREQWSGNNIKTRSL